MDDRLTREQIEELRVLLKSRVAAQNAHPIDTLCDLALSALRQDSSGGEERAYQMLEVYGVPRERAKSVANGIDVLAIRLNKEINALRSAPQDSRNEVLEQAAQCIEPSSGLSEDGTLLIRKAQAAIRSLKINAAEQVQNRPVTAIDGAPECSSLGGTTGPASAAPDGKIKLAKGE